MKTSLFEDGAVLNVLGKIVNSLSSREPSWRDDLMQEGLIQLWRSEQERPGQSTSWYLQSCRFRLQHYLDAGRSLDSGKRRNKQVVADTEEANGLPELLQTDSTTFDEISARDLMCALSAWLKPPERAVLDCLAEGFHPTDIRRRLQLSQPTINNLRRKIADLVARLD